MTKICPICNVEKDYSKYRLNPDGSIRGNDCTSCRSKKERVQLKLAFLEHYNSTCTCCGETDPRFLTLGHINDDGNKHRENLAEHQIMRQAKNAGWPEDQFTCLCFNCNSGRSSNGGVCPHKDITAIAYIDSLKVLDYRMGKQFVITNTSNVEARVAGRKAQAVRVRDVKDLIGTLTTEQLEAVRVALMAR